VTCGVPYGYPHLSSTRGKKFGNLFLAKLKIVITIALGIKMTIIIYAFGVENISNTVTIGFS